MPLEPDMGEARQLPLAAALEFEYGEINRDRSYHDIGSAFPLWTGL